MALLLNCTVGDDFNLTCGRQIARVISCLVGCGGAVNLITERVHVVSCCALSSEVWGLTNLASS